MDVVFSLCNLLFVHDRVVVNGLGVFTTELQKAYIHPVEDSISPAFKKIKFQFDVNVKDDLLSKSMGGDNADAEINSFVSKVHQRLKEGNKVQLKNIGFLYTHQTDEIILEQDLSINYVKKNFGLQGFIQEPINKIVPSKAPVVKSIPEKELKKPRVFLYILWGAAIVIAILAFWKMDAIKSFFNEVPGKNIAETKTRQKQPSKDAELQKEDAIQVDTVKRHDAAQDTSTQEVSAAHENVEVAVSVKEPDNNAKEEQSVVVHNAPDEVKPSGPVYYVIAGCFRSEYKANRLLEDLQSKGFENASIEGKTPNGLIRVCYASYPERRQASNYMLKLQNHGRKGVWIQKSK